MEKKEIKKVVKKEVAKKVVVKKVAAKKVVAKKIVAKKAPAKKVETKTTELKASTINFNPKVWELKFNKDLVAQVLYVQTSNARTGTAHAKSRDMVSGGGRKPWAQKGTGRARHGSSRSPIWVGGGVTFVPNYRNWKRNINKKMVKIAICMMLSERLREGLIEVVKVDETKSTKEIRVNVTKMFDLRKNSLVVSDNENVKNAISNVKKIDHTTPQNLSVVHLVRANKIVLSEEAINIIEKRLLNEK